MKSKLVNCILAITLVATLAIPVQLLSKSGSSAHEPIFITFDMPPEVELGDSPETAGISINSAGVIAGYYSGGAHSLSHGFVRAPDGTITIFEAPGAGPGGTTPTSINSSGEITGYFFDSNWTLHGFLRAPDGAITVFDAPGAGTSFSTFLAGTVAQSINDAGVITGFVNDANLMSHAFLRSRDGRLTTFDVPLEHATYTSAAAISAGGVVAGTFQTGDYTEGLVAGFVRSPDGGFSYFYAPDGGSIEYQLGINAMGTVTGLYMERNRELYHGFLRSADGAFMTIDVPGANGSSFPQSINQAGDIVGFYESKTPSYTASFVRHRDGSFEKFNPPGSNVSLALAINNAGEITGWYQDPYGPIRGFLRTWKSREH